MAFPLVVNPISETLELIEPWGQGHYAAVPLVVDITVTRTTAWGMLFTNGRTVTVEPMPRDRLYEFLVLDIDATYEHHFVGIGGVRFIPSFPQWDREETDFPFAF